MAFLGIDIGTGGCKSTVYSADGTLLSQAYREYTASYTVGWHELDAPAVFAAMKEVIAGAVAASPDKNIEAVCASSLGEAAVPIDREGNILYNAMVYTDARGEPETELLCERVGRMKIGTITGVTPNKMFTLPKVMWLREHRQEIFKRIWKFLQFEDLATWMLSGETCISYSLASRTMAFDVVNKCWSSEILDAAAISHEIFSTPVQTGTVVGTVLPAVARELGLPETAKVVVGSQDQVCAAIGCGIFHPGQAANGMGSTHCVTPVFDHPIINETTVNCGYACCPHAIKDLYATYSYSFSGGALIRWFRDTLARHENYLARRRGEGVYEALDKAVGKTPSPLLVLPHFTGAASPYMDDASRGLIWGLTLDTTLPELFRAFMEGISFEMLTSMERLRDVGININSLIACGGGSNSKVWLHIQSDIYNRPIRRLKNAEAGTIGCIMIAAVANGTFHSLEEAAGVFLELGGLYEPNLVLHKQYMEKYELYKRMYAAGKSILDK